MLSGSPACCLRWTSSYHFEFWDRERGFKCRHAADLDWDRKAEYWSGAQFGFNLLSCVVIIRFVRSFMLPVVPSTEKVRDHASRDARTRYCVRRPIHDLLRFRNAQFCDLHHSILLVRAVQTPETSITVRRRLVAEKHIACTVRLSILHTVHNLTGSCF